MCPIQLQSVCLLFLGCVCEQAYFRKWQETPHWTGGWNVLIDVLSDLECMDIDYDPRCTGAVSGLSRPWGEACLVSIVMGYLLLFVTPLTW